MKKIGDLFSVEYGNKLYEDKSRLKKAMNGTPLVAAGGRNNGIVGRYAIPATMRHFITVIRTGAGSVGAAFYHGYPCEASSDALILSPLETMSADEMLWYARLITCHRFRFSFGRKMTPTRLKALEVPAPGERPLAFPAPSLAAMVDGISSAMERLAVGSNTGSRADLTKGRTVGELFEIEYGNSYELCYLKLDKNGVNFVARGAKNNGVSARVARTTDGPFPAGCLTVALSGSVLETFVQLAPFYTAYHVAVLKPKTEMTTEEKLFCCLAIRLHRFRYSYGRQANGTLSTLLIPPLPSWVQSGQLGDIKSQLVADLKGTR